MRSHDSPSSNAKIILFLGFSLAALGIITNDHKGKIPALRTSMNIVTYPVKAMINMPYSASSNIAEFLTSHQNLSKENDELRRTVNIYAARDQQYRSIASQNKNLTKALDISSQLDDRYLLAKILAVDTDNFRHTVNIDKGTNDQAFEGQIALYGKSIYGQIIRTTPYSSELIRITDPNHAIPVQNVRTGDHALAVGAGRTNRVYLEQFDELENIRAGDLYVSSGLGTLFPTDFPVAIVKEKHYNPADSMTTISANTVADFNKVREVLLIWRDTKKLPKEIK
ncbi:MAG: rod shape-determining protein MreC [Thiotrichaceae bacterium]|nr:rod shape-determining protein MreC [Thiotrichaceae bacterium]